MMSLRVRTMGLALVLVGGLAGSGCTYMTDRGRDAMDLVDLGVTASREPHFALHFDFFNITPLGWSRVEGAYLGLGHRQFGVLDFDDRAWGVLLWGSERQDTGEFNPRDPHYMWQSELARLRDEGLPAPDAALRHNVGLLRMGMEGNPPPWPTFIACRRNIHLGWIGLYSGVRPIDFVDFILGWTTLDIIGDDVAAKKEPPS